MQMNKYLYKGVRIFILSALSIFLLLPPAFGKDAPKKEKGNEVSKSEAGNDEKGIEDKKIDESSPTGVIIKYEREVKNIVKKYKGKTEKAVKKQKNEELILKVRGFFDLGELARLSLGTHWKGRSSKERKEYSNLFQKLIERSYISKSDSLLGDYKVKYGKEDIDGGKALVKSTVIKEDADVDVEYQMKKEGSGWMIYNVIADETNLIRSYKTQFNSIIGKYGFKELMSRMNNKLLGYNNGD